jgi:carbonic anhydrase
VPANQITGLAPGEVFVHRNIANVVVHTDLNCLSVIQFAVDILKVRHVILCGHYGCSGVEAAMTKHRIGLSDNWLRHVQDVAEQYPDQFPRGITDSHATRRLAELNVLSQVANVCRTTIVIDAWRRAQPLSVHGWIYGLHDGHLRDLGLTVSRDGVLSADHAHAVAALGRAGEFVSRKD